MVVSELQNLSYKQREYSLIQIPQDRAKMENVPRIKPKSLSWDGDWKRAKKSPYQQPRKGESGGQPDVMPVISGQSAANKS
jgi:hypothetical protein